MTQWRKRGTDSREAKGGGLTHTAVSWGQESWSGFVLVCSLCGSTVGCAQGLTCADQCFITELHPSFSFIGFPKRYVKYTSVLKCTTRKQGGLKNYQVTWNNTTLWSLGFEGWIWSMFLYDKWRCGFVPSCGDKVFSSSAQESPSPSSKPSSEDHNLSVLPSLFFF